MSERVLDTAIIPVAGLGTRMAPYTYGEPKCMVPVYAGNDAIPNIHFALAECIDAGIENVILVVDADGEQRIRDYVGPMSDDRRKRYLNLGKTAAMEQEDAYRAGFNGLNIEYIVQNTTQYGTAVPTWLALHHTLQDAQPALRGVEHFAVTGGDDFVWHLDGSSELARAKQTWRNAGTPHLIMGTPVSRETAKSKGVLYIANDRLVEIVECPDGSYEQPIPENPIANISRYIFRCADVELVLNSYMEEPLPPGQREYRITDVVNRMVDQGIVIHRITGAYLDTGTPKNARQASNYITEQLEQAGRA
jgi:NDP-sugar pyrophosphorylase family protein